VARYYLIAVSFVAIALGWDSLLIKPARLLVVLVHEMWHGLSAMAGGVRLDTIRIHPDESGETLVTGHLQFLAFLLSVSAGYIGTAWTGAMLLRSGLQRSWERTTLGIFTLLLFYMSYLFTEPGSTAYLTGLLTSLLALVLLFLGRDASGKGLVVLGSLFVFYSLFDLYDFQRPQATDAAILARYLESRGLQSADAWIGPISVAWTICIVLVVALTLRSAALHVASDSQAAPQESALAPDAGAGSTDIPVESPGAPQPDAAPPSPPGALLPDIAAQGVATAPPGASSQSTPAQASPSASSPSAMDAAPPGWSADELDEIRQMVAQMKK